MKENWDLETSKMPHILTAISNICTAPAVLMLVKLWFKHFNNKADKIWRTPKQKH